MCLLDIVAEAEGDQFAGKNNFLFYIDLAAAQQQRIDVDYWGVRCNYRQEHTPTYVPARYQH